MPAPVYQEGYDPAKEQREGIGILPDTAWGEPENGLRAALSGPDKVRFNEPADYRLIIRNVSTATIRVAVAEDTFVCTGCVLRGAGRLRLLGGCTCRASVLICVICGAVFLSRLNLKMAPVRQPGNLPLPGEDNGARVRGLHGAVHWRMDSGMRPESGAPTGSGQHRYQSSERELKL